tara:strand:- start:7496 stop:7726 length:231 start_codon:yes stop_codon:yes gene_type:complete
MIKIEKDIPIPQRTRLPELPFSEMEINESFLAPVSFAEARLVQALRQRVVRFQRQHPPKKFSVVRDGEKMRVFRIQ